MAECSEEVCLEHIQAGLEALDLNSDLDANPGQVIQHLSSLPTAVFFNSRYIYRSALIFASRSKEWKFIRWLSQAGLYSYVQSKVTVVLDILEALATDDLETVQSLISKDVDGEQVLFKSMCGYNLISLLLLHNCTPTCLEFVIDQLIKSESIKCVNPRNGCDSHGFTPLMSAVLANNLECVQSLLEKEANINLTSKKFMGIDSYAFKATRPVHTGMAVYKDDIFYGESKTPLMYAVCVDNVKCVELLLKFDPDVCRYCLRLMNAFGYAALTCNFLCLNLLLETFKDEGGFGAQGNQVTDFGQKNMNGGETSGKFNNLFSGFSFNFNENTKEEPKLFQAEPDLPKVSSPKVSPKSKALTSTRNRGKHSREHSKRGGTSTSDRKHFAETTFLFGEDAVGDRILFQRNRGKNKDFKQMRLAAEASVPYAVAGGDVGCLELLLKHCVQLNNVNKQGRTALMVAAEDGKIDCLKILLKNWAEVSKKDGESGKEDTALMLACKNGHLECVKLLLPYKASVSARNGAGENALMYACKYGRTECVKLLMEHNADVLSKSDSGQTALMISILNKQYDCAQLILQSDQARANIGIKDIANRNAIMHAVVLNELSYLELLFNVLKENGDSQNSDQPSVTEKEDNDKNSEPCNSDSKISTEKLIADAIKKSMNQDKIENEKPPEYSITCLAEESISCAIEGKNMECIEFVLSHCVDLNQEDSNGKSPLMLASRIGNIEVVKLLLSKNADINFRNLKGDNALNVATRAGNLECLKYLLEHGADTSFVNKDGKSATMIATSCGESKCLKLLVKHGAVIAKQISPKMIYAAICDNECLKILADAGAYIDIGRLYNLQHFEKILNYPDSLQILLEKGRLFSKECIVNSKQSVCPGFSIDNHHQLKSVRLLLDHNIFNWRKFCQNDSLKDILFAAVSVGAPPGKILYKNQKLLSPLLYSIYTKNLVVMKYVIANLYFTIDDYRALITDKKVMDLADTDSLVRRPILKQLCRQPWSLQTISLLTISTALFENQVDKPRGQQVDCLPIPEKFKTILKFGGSCSRLCPHDWRRIGLPPQPAEPCDIMCPTKPIYPPPHLLKHCDNSSCNCGDIGLTIKLSNDNDDDDDDHNTSSSSSSSSSSSTSSSPANSPPASASNSSRSSRATSPQSSGHSRTSSPAYSPAPSDPPVLPASNPPVLPASNPPVLPASNPLVLPPSNLPVSPASNPPLLPPSNLPVLPPSDPPVSSASSPPVSPASDLHRFLLPFKL